MVRVELSLLPRWLALLFRCFINAGSVGAPTAQAHGDGDKDVITGELATRLHTLATRRPFARALNIPSLAPS